MSLSNVSRSMSAGLNSWLKPNTWHAVYNRPGGMVERSMRPSAGTAYLCPSSSFRNFFWYWVGLLRSTTVMPLLRVPKLASLSMPVIFTAPVCGLMSTR